MLLHEMELEIPQPTGTTDLVGYYRDAVARALPPDQVPMRFVVTSSGLKGCHCEMATLTEMTPEQRRRTSSLFDFAPRGVENQSRFNAVLLVPTGIGAVIGGHAGDAGPVARLMAKACDTLVTHPNVVNASDVNELPENGLYVEGSVDRKSVVRERV